MRDHGAEPEVEAWSAGVVRPKREARARRSGEEPRSRGRKKPGKGSGEGREKRSELPKGLILHYIVFRDRDAP